MDLQRTAAAVPFVGIMVLAMSFGAPLVVFFSPPTVLYLFIGTWAAWFLSSGADRPALREALRSPHPSTDTLARGLEVARAGRRALWGVTLLAMIGHAIQFLNVLDDPTAFGPLLSVLFLAPLQAFFLDILVVGPAEQKVVARAAELGVADRVLAPVPRRIEST
jgi:hypothetical protein